MNAQGGGGFDLRQGAVFSQTNGLTGNAVLANFRWSDGELVQAGQFPTGGGGTARSVGFGPAGPLSGGIGGIGALLGNGPGGPTPGQGSVILSEPRGGTLTSISDSQRPAASWVTRLRSGSTTRVGRWW